MVRVGDIYIYIYTFAWTFAWSCWILAGTGTRCRICRSRESQTCSMDDMSGEYAGHPRTGMFSASSNCVHILATWGRALSCCNMRWWSWMNGTTMGLRISSIKCTCSLSITNACPYYNPNATMGHSIHNVDINKLLTHTTPYTLSAIWPGFICEENTSPKCQTPSNVSICTLKSVCDDELQSGRDPDEEDEHADELPSDGFWQFVQKFFGYVNRLLQYLSGCLVSDDLGSEDVGCGGPGLVRLLVVCGRMYCQILWNAFGDGLW